MAYAVYLREVIIFTLMFYIIVINHYKSMKSIDNVKSNQNYKLLQFILVKINVYGVTATTMITKSKTEYCYFPNREENCKYCSCASNSCYRSKNMTSIRR